MTTKLQVYKCDVCGNIVEVISEGRGQLVCCGQSMTLMKEQVEEKGKEKHLPVVEETKAGIKVKVGSIAHPMEEKHYIEWIQAISNGQTWRKFLSPGDAPEAEFPLKAEKINVREYCTIHGLWKS